MSEIQVKLGRGKSIDDSLLEGAVMGLSAEEISERIAGALTPARVMVRLRQMFTGGTRLDDAERELAILRLLEKNLVDLNRMMLDKDIATVQLQYAKELMNRLAARRKLAEEDINSHNAAIGRELGHVVDLVLVFMKGALREKVDPQKWDELVLDAMAMAQLEIEKHQVEA